MRYAMPPYGSLGWTLRPQSQLPLAGKGTVSDNLALPGAVLPPSNPKPYTSGRVDG